MDKVQKNTFTDFNAPSSEPFRLYLEIFSLNARATKIKRYEPDILILYVI
jgi:hypothetical protein